MHEKLHKILLVNPPGTVFVQPDGTRQVKEISAPLGLAYLAAEVMRLGYEVRVYDMAIENFYHEIQVSSDTVLYGDTYDQYRRVLEDYRPDMVGFSCILSNRSNSVLELCRITKEADREIITVVGGHHATALPNHLLQGNTDFVVLGEADHSFPALIDTLRTGGDIHCVNGIVYPGNGGLVVQPRVDFVKDLDTLPYPDWEAVGLEKYWSLPNMNNSQGKGRFGPIHTSRGCPHVCNYCAVPLHTGERNFRARDLDLVIKEIEWLNGKYQIQEIQFMDDNFFVNKTRLKDLCRRLISKFPGLYFNVPTGTDIANLDYELIDLMKAAGFHYLSLGLETGDMDVQGKFVDKRIDLVETRKKVEYMRKLGFHLSGLFMLGFPGETREQIGKTVDYATSMDFDRLYLIMVTPLPGSGLYDYCLKNNLLYDDFDVAKLRYSNTFIKNPNISRAELEGIRRTVWEEYMSKRVDLNEYAKRGWSENFKPDECRTAGAGKEV
jgi:anaerobic magnesium-protoporphyrin IX monomethyl ester cyclase